MTKNTYVKIIASPELSRMKLGGLAAEFEKTFSGSRDYYGIVHQLLQESDVEGDVLSDQHGLALVALREGEMCIRDRTLPTVARGLLTKLVVSSVINGTHGRSLLVA